MARELSIAEQGIQVLLSGLASRLEYLGPEPLPLDESSGLSIVYSCMVAPDTTVTGGTIVMARPIYRILATGIGQNMGVGGLDVLADDMHALLQTAHIAIAGGQISTITRLRSISEPSVDANGVVRQWVGGWYRLVVEYGG